MRTRGWILMALVGCDSGHGPPPKEPVSPEREKVKPPGPVETTILVDAGVGDAAHPEPSPPSPELLAAKPWIGRQFLTGAVRGKPVHTTFSLRRHGAEGMLQVATLVPATTTGVGLLDEVDSWSPQLVKEYVGTVRESNGVHSLTLNGTVDSIQLECKVTKLRAAVATARRGRTPTKPGAEECGDTGRWVPSATSAIDALHCTPEPEEWNQIAFAAAPGIEWLHVNDDCVIQGGGWRLVAADGKIEHARVAAKPGPNMPGKSPRKAPRKAP